MKKSFTEMRAYLRKKSRLDVKVLAIIDSKQNRRDLTGVHFQTRDIGAGGMGLETVLALEANDIIECQILLPAGRIATAHGIVKNVKLEHRGKVIVRQAGVEFLNVSDVDRKAIADFVGSGDFMV